MKYVLLVSHGEFATGLHKAVSMFSGEDRTDILSTCLKNGMGADEFAENVKELISDIGPEDEIILFADIVGGSPLTTSANVIAQNGLIDRTTMIGGMNLPLVLSTVIAKDMSEDLNAELQDTIIPESKEAIRPFFVEVEEEADEI